METFNISTGKPTNIFNIIDLICELDNTVKVIKEDVGLGEHSKINPTLIRRNNEVKGCSLSIDRVLTKTNWKPTISIFDMIRDALI